jgi:hypothetical protein
MRYMWYDISYIIYGIWDVICDMWYNVIWYILYMVYDIYVIWYMIWYYVVYDIWDICDIWYVIWCMIWYMILNDMIYVMIYYMIWYMIYDTRYYIFNCNWLTPGGSSTVHIYTQTIHRTTQFTNQEECGPCPVFASYTLAFALQLRKKHGKILSQGSRRVPAGTMKTEYTEQSIHKSNNT